MVGLRTHTCTNTCPDTCVHAWTHACTRGGGSDAPSSPACTGGSAGPSMAGSAAHPHPQLHPACSPPASPSGTPQTPFPKCTLCPERPRMGTGCLAGSTQFCKITLTLPQPRFLVSAELVILVVWCYQDAGCCNLSTKPEQSRGGAGAPREQEQPMTDTHLPEHNTRRTASLPAMPREGAAIGASYGLPDPHLGSSPFIYVYIYI